MIATVIYNKKIINNIDFSLYNHTPFPQPLAILNYISDKEFKIQYIHKETIWNMKNGITGSGSWHSIVLRIFTKEWYDAIKSLPNSFDKKSKEICIKNHAKYTTGFYSFKSMMLYHHAGGLTFSDIIKYFKYFYFITNIQTILKAIFISFVPKSSIKYLFKESYSYIDRVIGKINY
jgi:hypothetical protein